MSTPDRPQSASDGAAALERFESTLPARHLAPLWRVMRTLAPREPPAAAVPARWRYAEVREQLLTAAALISARDAERRVLVLENPALPGGSRVTPSLYAGIQLLLPGECAPAHRHTAAALRFVLEGEGAYTTVGGHRIAMHPGDLVLTPSWSLHEHGHEGREPVLWLDGLDVPIVNALNAGFAEDGPRDTREPRECLDPSGLSFPRERVLEALEAEQSAGSPDRHCGFTVTYAAPAAAGLLPSLGASMQRLPAGFAGRAYRSSDGEVLAVLSGEGRIEFADRSFALEPRDIVAVPGWTWHALSADRELTLFSFSDRPLQRYLGLWREERA